MKLLSFIVISSFLLMTSCTHDSPFEDINKDSIRNPIVSNNCDTDTIYFVNVIKPIINNSCATTNCHDKSTAAEGIVLDSYANIFISGIVKAGNPLESKLYDVITESGGEDAMPPNNPLSNTQISLIKTWIEQGALNNECVEDCKMTNLDFTADIWPTINNNCTSCHTTNNASGGVVIENLDDVKVLIDNSKLVDVINGQNGASLMPPGNKLSQCNIDQIEQWIKDGASGGDSGGGDGGGTPTNCDSNTAYFVNTVKPLINNSCATTGCHDARSARDGVVLDSYANIIRTGKVKAGNPYSSKLYKVLVDSGDDLMPPNRPLSNDQIGIIKKWIEQGALNNECTEDCSTVNVTFSKNIWPTINVNCKSCHSGGSPKGGISINNYNDVKVLVDNSKLVNALYGSNGVSLMPPNAQLSQCKIDQIEKWIEDGALNN